MKPTRYHTFWRRVGAALADSTVLTAIHLPWAFLVAVTVGFVSNRAALVLSLMSGAVALVYAPYFHARWGQTIGKMACGIRVQDAGDESRGITGRQAIAREVPNAILWLILVGGFIGVAVSADADRLLRFDEDRRTWDVEGSALAWFLLLASVQLAWIGLEALTMAFNARRRAIHDFVAGTVVVKTGYAGQPWPKVFDDQIVYAVQMDATAPAFGVAGPLSDVHPRYRAGWPRFWAAVIDNFVFFMPWSVVALPITFAADNARVTFLVGAVGAAGYALYDVVLHARGGKTIGKMATSVTVVDAETLGPITWRQAWRRSVGLWLAVATALVGAVGFTGFEGQSVDTFLGANINTGWLVPAFICMLVSPQRRALHDLIAGTTVIRDAYMVQTVPPAPGPMPPPVPPPVHFRSAPPADLPPGFPPPPPPYQPGLGQQ